MRLTIPDPVQAGQKYPDLQSLVEESLGVGLGNPVAYLEVGAYPDVFNVEPFEVRYPGCMMCCSAAF